MQYGEVAAVVGRRRCWSPDQQQQSAMLIILLTGNSYNISNIKFTPTYK